MNKHQTPIAGERTQPEHEIKSRTYNYDTVYRAYLAGNEVPRLGNNGVAIFVVWLEKYTKRIDLGSEAQGHDKPQSEPQFPGSERGGLLFNGKTAKEWFELHEVMRNDLSRVVEEKSQLRQDYGRAINELETQDKTIEGLRGEIRKQEDLNTELRRVIDNAPVVQDLGTRDPRL
jgi:hypothetical protein